jgi:gas vesicle protein
MSRYTFDDDEPYVVIEKHESSISSFLIGAAIGAGLALLFAPRSGEETRRGIHRRARLARRAARRMATDVSDTVSETFSDARRRVEEKIDNAREAIELKKQQVHRAMEAGRAAANEARDDLERRIAETKAAYKAGAGVAAGSASGASRVPAASTAVDEADEE